MKNIKHILPQSVIPNFFSFLVYTRSVLMFLKYMSLLLKAFMENISDDLSPEYAPLVYDLYLYLRATLKKIFDFFLGT